MKSSRYVVYQRIWHGWSCERGAPCTRTQGTKCPRTSYHASNTWQEITPSSCHPCGLTGVVTLAHEISRSLTALSSRICKSESFWYQGGQGVNSHTWKAAWLGLCIRHIKQKNTETEDYFFISVGAGDEVESYVDCICRWPEVEVEDGVGFEWPYRGLYVCNAFCWNGNKQTLYGLIRSDLVRPCNRSHWQLGPLPRAWLSAPIGSDTVLISHLKCLERGNVGHPQATSVQGHFSKEGFKPAPVSPMF